MRRIDIATQQALVRADTTTVRLRAVKFKHSTFPDGEFRFVEYNKNIVVNSEEYEAAGIEMQDASISGEPGDTVRLRFATIGTTVPFYFAQANHGLETIASEVTSFLYDTGTDTVDTTYVTTPLEVRSVTSDTDGTMVIDLGYLSASNKSFPTLSYNPADYPDLFR